MMARGKFHVTDHILCHLIDFHHLIDQLLSKQEQTISWTNGHAIIENEALMHKHTYNNEIMKWAAGFQASFKSSVVNMRNEWIGDTCSLIQY